MDVRMDIFIVLNTITALSNFLILAHLICMQNKLEDLNEMIKGWIEK